MNFRRVLPVCAPLRRSLSYATDTIRPPHIKHKIPQKRASKLLNELKNEEYARLRAGRDFPQIRAGDSIQIDKLPYVSSTTPDIIKGVVIGKQNKASDTSIRLLNVEYGTPVMRLLTMYSPLIKNIKVLQKAFIHKGKKRVRRAKLYYLQNLHPDNYTVK